jgi:hypothetical protein
VGSLAARSLNEISETSNGMSIVEFDTYTDSSSLLIEHPLQTFIGFWPGFRRLKAVAIVIVQN